jgi:hypothetical protein
METADKKELEIFDTFREAFDLQKSDINHIIDTVTFKNNKDIFGEFEPITSDKAERLNATPRDGRLDRLHDECGWLDWPGGNWAARSHDWGI